jgi:large subunit ribosomal protein LP2
MKYTAAYMLLALGGNATPSADDVSKLLSEAGIEVDANALSLCMSKLEGKNIEELLADEMVTERLVAGGGGGGGAGGAAGGADGAAAEEEKVEEEEEEEAVEVGNMFGGDEDDGW